MWLYGCGARCGYTDVVLDVVVINKEYLVQLCAAATAVALIECYIRINHSTLLLEFDSFFGFSSFERD